MENICFTTFLPLCFDFRWYGFKMLRFLFVLSIYVTHAPCGNDFTKSYTYISTGEFDQHFSDRWRPQLYLFLYLYRRGGIIRIIFIFIVIIGYCWFICLNNIFAQIKIPGHHGTSDDGHPYQCRLNGFRCLICFVFFGLTQLSGLICDYLTICNSSNRWSQSSNMQRKQFEILQCFIKFT